MRKPLVSLFTAALLGIAGNGMAGVGQEGTANISPSATYPTEVIADYVLGCMISNGASPDILRKCACSFDFVAASIPYAEYEQIESLLRLQQMPGVGRNAVYKNANWAKQAVTNLREIQAESTLRCF